jgi:TatD DNase family protein
MIDFHCHLDLYTDPKETATKVGTSKAYILSVTTTPSAWKGTSQLGEGNPRIRTALGLHPAIAHERHHELGLFDDLLQHTAYVGEIGLDGSPELKHCHRIQTQVFEHVLASCARAGGKVTTIHSRRAADQVLDILAASPSSGLHILHWFSGTQTQLKRAIDLGCWFSVGPAMLCGARGLALASKMPRDRILTETDGPFAMTGDRPFEPAEVNLALDRLAGLWNCPLDEVDKQIRANLQVVGRAAGPAGEVLTYDASPG